MNMDINVNYTVPIDQLGGQSVQMSDHGPFYLFSAALPVHRVDYKDSVPHIYPCFLTSCTDWIEKLPELHCPPGAAVGWTKVKDAVGNEEKIATTVKSADKIRDLIQDMYSDWGVVEIKSLAHRKVEEVDLKMFNSILYPNVIEPVMSTSDLKDKADKIGGLEARKLSVADGLKVIASVQFANAYGLDKQILYRQAAEECYESFIQALRYCMKELGDSDGQLRLRLAGDKESKISYDTKDFYLQWLLAKLPIMDTQSQTQAPVVVQFPEGFTSGGITAEQLEAILSKVVVAQSQVVEPKAKVRKPAQVEE